MANMTFKTNLLPDNTGGQKALGSTTAKWAINGNDDPKLTDTNDKVTQTNTTTNKNYRILFSNSDNDTNEIEQVRKNTNLTYNPSTKVLTVANLEGNAKTASGLKDIGSGSNIFYYKTTASTGSANDLVATGYQPGIATVKNSTASTNGGPTSGWLTYLTIPDGTSFQLGIHDSDNLYFYKRWYSNNSWSSWSKMNAGFADSAGYLKQSYFNIQTGTNKKSLISLETLMNWLINIKGYIPSNIDCYKFLPVKLAYADNDILQISIDSVNYEVQLAGCIIEFLGYATNYNTGIFRLRIHTSPTNSFTASTGYIKIPTSSIIEYTCNGSSYTPTWRLIASTNNFANYTDASEYRAILLSGETWSSAASGQASIKNNKCNIYYDAPYIDSEKPANNRPMGLGFKPSTNELYVGGLVKINSNENTVTIGSQNISYKDAYGTDRSVISFASIATSSTQASGAAVIIGGGGLTVVGSGESASNNYTNLTTNGTTAVTGNTENLYLLSDGDILLESKTDTFANRIGVKIDTSGNLIPIKAETGNNNTQSIGSSSYKWANVYTNSLNTYLAYSQNISNYIWHRIASFSTPNAGNTDIDAIIDINQYYNGGKFGRAKISFRCNAASNSNGVCSGTVNWIIRKGWAVDDLYIAYYGSGGNSAYADVFLKCSTWARTTISYIKNTNWTFYNSSETSTDNGANASPRYTTNTHTECYKFINTDAADSARWSLHNKTAYAAVNPATDMSVNFGNVTINGDLTITGIITQGSDKNIKHDIQNISKKYNKFYNSLQPKQFKYNQDSTNRNRFGFIAQEVKEAYQKAELDYTQDSIIKKHENNENGEWDLNMMDIVPLNTWQIQYMKQEIELLKAEIAELRKLVENDG